MISLRKLFTLLIAVVAAQLVPSAGDAARIIMRDGRELEGQTAMVRGVAENPEEGARIIGGVDVKPILVIHDDLRRTFVSKRRIQNVGNEAPPRVVKIDIRQNVSENANSIGGVGPIVRVTPFDQHGRRIFTMKTSEGPVDVIQGITEITPHFSRVQGLRGGRSLVWDMRIATSSIPRDQLRKILKNNLDQTDANSRLEEVRLYIQMRRYSDARIVLEEIMKDFPELKQFEKEVRALRQMGARRLLEEIEMRSDGGQHRLVQSLLDNFPSDNVAGETLQHVREIQQRYSDERTRGEKILKLFGEFHDQVSDASQRGRIGPIRDELKDELNHNTLSRMTAFYQLSTDDQLTPEQKLSLAISGWLIGSNNATENLPVALSLFEVRELIYQYLTEDLKVNRDRILEEIRAQEGGTPTQVARLLQNMKPPLPPKAESQIASGYFKLTATGMNNLPVDYYVQLPPEYDPHRSYPVILTLCGSGTTAQHQLDWWAGSLDDDGKRMGQSTRNGYVVLAVDWRQPHQIKYEYSARTHLAVLASLRDACRRFSLDTDRVFLTGHSIGGDAAWDIALAHPDLWAGVIPIVSTANKYITHYRQNAEYVPMYVVAGELDGGKLAHNSDQLDRYLRGGNDVTVVEYLGRGHEHFYDEIQRIFDWMGRRERNFFPDEFETNSMRAWDNYFWWVEVRGFPEATIVDPASWPPPRGTRPAKIEGKITKSNVYVNTATSQVTVWLSPKMIDLENQRVSVIINNRRVVGPTDFIEPDVGIILEDARTRGDRKNPFWAKVEWPAERIGFRSR